MKLKYGLSLVALVLLLLSSCINDDYNGPDSNLPSRTLLVYLGGDNNDLSSSLKDEVEAMRKGWTYTGNRCLIYTDPVNDVPRLLSLRGGCASHPEPYIDTLAVYQEENSSSATVFKRVIEDMILREPADSYGLIVASHGSGWLPEGTLSNPSRSIGVDIHPGNSEETNREMELADLVSAIPDNQFDFVIFEACLMSGVEVAYGMRNKAKYIVASSAELLVPGFVPIYPSSFHYLMDTSITVEQSLQSFADDYYNYRNKQNGAFKSATLSVIKTEKLDALASVASEIFANGNALPELSDAQHFDRPGIYGDTNIARFYDFMDYMQRIATVDQYTRLESEMNKIVVWKAATPLFLQGYNGFYVTNHSGMTIYVEQDAYPKLNLSYHLTDWYNATH